MVVSRHQMSLVQTGKMSKEHHESLKVGVVAVDEVEAAVEDMEVVDSEEVVADTVEVVEDMVDNNMVEAVAKEEVDMVVEDKDIIKDINAPLRNCISIKVKMFCI